VRSLPIANQRRQAPASVRLLLTQKLRNDGPLAFRIKEPGQSRRRPQENRAIQYSLRGSFSVQVIAQHPDVGLHLGASAIVSGSRADGNGGQGGSVEVRIVCFPRLVIEAQPTPCALVVACRELLGPHVVECRARVGGELSVLRVATG